MIETKVFKEPWDVDRRLAEIELERATLLEVRNVARASAANATSFHPLNAAGTFSYQDGSWALRDRHVDDRWSVDRSNGVEAIKNERLGLRVIFCNVDTAADDLHDPKPRSPKGAGAERACVGNLFGEDLPRFAPTPRDGIATYYLMVDTRGAAELTRPVVKGRTFRAYIERIYLSDGDDLDTDSILLNDEDRADDFDPMVERK